MAGGARRWHEKHSVFGSGCYSRACLGIDGALARSLWSVLAISVAATAAWWRRGWPPGTQGYLLAATLGFNMGISTWVASDHPLRASSRPQGSRASWPGQPIDTARASGEVPTQYISCSDMRRREKQREKAAEPKSAKHETMGLPERVRTPYCSVSTTRKRD